jgi:hypothetical protein
LEETGVALEATQAATAALGPEHGGVLAGLGEVGEAALADLVEGAAAGGGGDEDLLGAPERRSTVRAPPAISRSPPRSCARLPCRGSFAVATARSATGPNGSSAMTPLDDQEAIVLGLVCAALCCALTHDREGYARLVEQCGKPDHILVRHARLVVGDNGEDAVALGPLAVAEMRRRGEDQIVSLVESSSAVRCCVRAVPRRPTLTSARWPSHFGRRVHRHSSTGRCVRRVHDARLGLGQGDLPTEGVQRLQSADRRAQHDRRRRGLTHRARLEAIGVDGILEDSEVDGLRDLTFNAFALVDKAILSDGGRFDDYQLLTEWLELGPPRNP